MNCHLGFLDLLSKVSHCLHNLFQALSSHDEFIFKFTVKIIQNSSKFRQSSLT